jgi:hypothetical protein
MKIVDISKDYLKGNVPSTVDVLRAGKIKTNSGMLI